MANLRFPNISGKTPGEQLQQIRSYLYQLVQELNFLFNSGGGNAIAESTTAGEDLSGGGGGLTPGSVTTEYLADGAVTPAKLSFTPVDFADFSGAGFHNSLYRGENLGDHVTDEQYATIAAGTFDGLWIGDYWVIGGVTYRIAAFDYYYNTGDTSRRLTSWGTARRTWEFRTRFSCSTSRREPSARVWTQTATAERTAERKRRQSAK